MSEQHAGPPGGLLAGVKRLVHRVEDGLLMLILSGMIVLAATQIVLRNVFHESLLWGDPALRVAVLWVGLLGAMVASREDRQISVDVLSRFMPEKWKPRVRVVTDLFTAVVACFLAWHAGRLVAMEYEGGMSAFGVVPIWVCELILPFGLGVIGLRYVVSTLIHLRQLRKPGELAP